MKQLTSLLCVCLIISSTYGQTKIDPKDIFQSPSYRFVTDAQIAAWSKVPTKLTTDAIMPTDQQQFVTSVEKARWNANTKIKASFNIGFKQIDSLTIEPYLIVPAMSDNEKNKLALPPAGSILIILNTDYNQLYYRTATTPWKKIWDSQ